MELSERLKGADTYTIEIEFIILTNNDLDMDFQNGTFLLVHAVCNKILQIFGITEIQWTTLSKFIEF